MNRQNSAHTMSDSSSDDDDDIGIPLAQRLAGTLRHKAVASISPKADTLQVKRSYVSNNFGPHRKKIRISNESDDEEDVSIVRTEPAPSECSASCSVNSEQPRSRFTSVHAMCDSDSDDSLELQNIAVPKSTAFQGKKVPIVEEKRKNTEVKKKLQETKKLQKDEQKRLRDNEREEKRRMKELEAKRKRIERDQKKAMNKTECLKYMSVCIDESIIQNPCGAEILMALKNANIKYDVQKQSYPNIITFWRETVEIIDTENNIRCENKEILEDNVLIWLPIAEFIDLVNNHVQRQAGDFVSRDQQTLREFVELAKATLENRPVTLLVQGLENYHRTKKNSKKSKGAKNKTDMVNVTKLEVDQVLMDLQISTSCNVRLMETDAEVAKTVLQFTKAIAETPFKRGRMQAGVSFHIDTKGSVKVDRDGTGLLQVWRQQITQFHNVTGQVADAIIREYPSPALLYRAYQSCHMEKQKEKLLEDIMVRRVYGPMETSRRVGKEMSRRMYHLFSTTDPELVLT